MTKDVVIYTDGACSKNPGTGGWCAILWYKNKQKLLSGCEENTTNNKMELKAVVAGLKALNQRCKERIFSDSAYSVNAIHKGWLDTWMKNNWVTENKEKVKNIDLWEQLAYLMNIHNVRFEKIKGHADDEYNNICDSIARQMIKNSIKGKVFK